MPRPPTAAIPEVDAYLQAAPEPVRARLEALRTLIRTEAPQAVERMAYGLRTELPLDLVRRILRWRLERMGEQT